MSARYGIVLLVLATLSAQQSVTIPTSDGGSICAILSGRGSRGVVLAHGGQFKKESWRDQAKVLASKGYRTIAFDFRGFGCSTGPGQSDFDNAPFHNDVLAAVDYLKSHGAKTVYAIGGSFGSSALGDASIKTPGAIERIVFLGESPNLPADGLHSRSLFIVARNDANSGGPRLPGIQAQFNRAPQPKQLIVLDGSAHAQFLFQTEHATRVMQEILRFFSAP